VIREMGEINAANAIQRLPKLMGKTMKRREFMALAGASVAWPFAALAQQPGRTYRLGCLRAGQPHKPFFDELRRGGFIEGQNLTVEYRAVGQHVDLIPQYAAELVKASVDVIVASGDETVRALQQTTKTIPIVAIVGDMLGSGLVTSLARPEGNTTGVSILAGENDRQTTGHLDRGSARASPDGSPGRCQIRKRCEA
jgi:putative ABC transport system substrate-binding protein